ncbi:MAG: phosphoenolpyruvate--protein phosphotransferase [Treponema sp.]|jgi:phosphotransferase system enzyme I (PtsI)|nr:phosphoenolpyruvate--protein phosphotransferase [Treponema sp.]
MKIFTGISVYPGIVIGKALLYQEDDYSEIPRYTIGQEQVEGELKRFVDAVKDTVEDLQILKESSREMNLEQSAIFNAHLLMAEDPDFHYQIKARLESKYENVEWIVWEVARDLCQKLLMSSDAYLREKAADVSDVSRRIISFLLGVQRFSLANLAEDVVLVSRNLLLSDILTMNKTRIKALVMDLGSRTSHTAIFIRTFGIPSVLGLSNAVREINSGDTLIVDGEKGELILDPDETALERYRRKLAEYSHDSDKLSALSRLPAETKDHHRVVLRANIELPEEAGDLERCGAEGIGLYRSEFLFMGSGKAAEEERQYLAYSQVIKTMKGKPVTIRTVDVGGDKILPGLPRNDEINPLLGWRAIRFSLALPEMFKTQLRAILRASTEGPVKIMFPMISGIEELEQALAVLEEAKAECRRKGQPYSDNIEVGTMIEIPAAVVTADILAEKSDFLSIGTNDLVQYTLAVDRGNERVSYLAQPTHPAVLRFIKQTIDAAHHRGIKAVMCGEFAGDPKAAALLLGMGLDEFSMAAISLPQIKNIIRGVNMADCKALALKALACTSFKQVDALVESWMAEHFGS